MAAMHEAKRPTATTTTLPPSPSPSPSPSAVAPNPHLPYHHHHYGTFSPPPHVVGAAYDASGIGFGCRSVVAFPCNVQQQVLVEGIPVREPPLPFCGVGIGWFLFLLGFFLAAIPWYAGAFLLFFVALDHREKPGLMACTIAGIFALVPFILNGIRMHPFW
ncbi:large ribosomal subunit protein eL20z-like [Phragmites australis]|uniref:large ribosomal subunit protein eL20z-like n=1 Tax=Phragmites australis TaxID=29695 RepID=UPI002D79BE3F|nr:large ribosomal subunit protein eL20z-like [Phragmites australis]